MASGNEVSLLVRLCGQGAPIASVGLYLAPLPTIQQITNTGTVGGLPLLPYTTMASNAFMWTIYGIMKQEPRVWSCNGIGCALAIFYCYQFASLIPKSKQASILEASTPTLPGTVAQHFHFALAVFFATTFLAIARPFAAGTANLIGNTAVLLCIVMFASPLSVIKVVLETKSAKSIPLPFTVISCLNCFMWVVFGWFDIGDINIWLPNILGLTFGIIQVILKLVLGSNDVHPSPAYQSVALAPLP